MTTLAHIARARFGIDVAVSGRFSRPGWRYVGLTRARCPDCSSSVHEARKPYEAAGHMLEYRAYICPTCPRIWDRKGLAAHLLP